MGREIRMVPPFWVHPKTQKFDFRSQRYEDCLQPMHNQPYIEAFREWLKEHELWEKGEHPDQDPKYSHYAQFGGDAPNIEYYRPNWSKETATWYQVYETVSEGTPVTPAFETKEELINYLVCNGDFWDQKRREEGGSIMCCDPWPRAQAEKFVNDVGWAPSLVFDGKKVMTGVEAL